MSYGVRSFFTGAAFLIFVHSSILAQRADSIPVLNAGEVRDILRSGRLDSAAGILRTADSLFKRAANMRGHSLVDFIVTGFCFENGLMQQAEPRARRLFSLPDSLFSDSLKNELRFSRAVGALKVTSHPGADSSISEALAIFSRSGNRARAGELSFLLAKLRFRQKRYVETENLLLRRCLPLYTAAGNGRGRCETFDLLGKTYLALKRTSEAKWFFIQELMLAQRRADKSLTAAAHTGLGRVKTKLGDLAPAKTDLDSSRALLGNSSNYSLLADLYLGYKELHRALNDPATAEAADKRSGGYAAKQEAINRYRTDRAAYFLDIYTAERSVSVTGKPKPGHPAVKPQGTRLIVIILSFGVAVILFFLLRRRRS